MKIHLPLLSLGAALLLSSCASTDSAENKQLLSVANTNPKPNAIAGMWHRNASDSNYAYRCSVLFKSDGTGIESLYADAGIYGVEDINTKFTWTYQGGGVWKTIAPTSPGYDLWVWRVSQGKLLRNGGAPMYYAQVFERVAE